MDVYKVFNPSDLKLLFYRIYCSFILDLKTKNKQLYILNYNSNFLLDKDIQFFIFKWLYPSSFKLNVENVSRALPPGPPLNLFRGSECAQTPYCIFSPNSCKVKIFFLSWIMPWDVSQSKCL